MDEPQVGREYMVRHTFRGVLFLRVRHVSAAAVRGKLTSGTFTTLRGCRVREGESVTVLRALCSFSEVHERR